MQPPSTLAFGPFRLDLASGRLHHGDEVVPLGGRALALLQALHAARGATLTKDALLAAGWPGLVVEEGNLTVQIAALRRALGAGADGQDWIVTVPRIGYRLALAPEPETAVKVPRLVVLPFAGDGDPMGDWFAAGVADDLVAALGRFRSFAVLSRQSGAGRSGTVREIASELGVAYVLTGSARRAGDHLRLVTELIDGESGRVLWAERFDGEADQIFDVQDRIVASTAAILEPRIAQAELDRSRSRPATTLSAHDLYLRARSLIHLETEPANREAQALLARALEEAPSHPLYLATACWCLEHRITVGWPLLGPNDRAFCLHLADRAARAADGDQAVLLHCAVTFLQVGRDYDRGLALAEEAARTNPNSVFARIAQGVTVLHCGDPADAIAAFDKVIELSPGDPRRYMPQCGKAMALFMAGRAPAAIDEANRAIAVNPSFDFSHWVLVAALAAEDRLAEARAAAARLLALNPALTLAHVRDSQPARFPERIEAMIDQLRRAGLPEG